MDVVHALFEDIREHPEDDLPRLALADWLSEQGADDEVARGEFIRIQCRLARLPAEAPGRADLAWREQQLWWDHIENWLGADLYEAARSFRFRRGLIHLELDGSALRGCDLGRLWQLPAWLWVEYLELVHPRSEQLDGLLAGPVCGGLHRLELRDGSVLWPGLEEFEEAANPRTTLRHFRANRTSLDESSARSMASDLRLADLKSMHLGENRLDSRALLALGESPGFDRLIDLDVRNNILSERPDATRRFLGSRVARNLVRLGLRATHLFEPGNADLETVPGLPTLRELDLGANHLTDRDLGRLAGCPLLRSLERLDLSQNEIGEDGITALGQAGAQNELVWLDLTENPLYPEGYEALARIPGDRLPNLRRLVLSSNSLIPPRVRGMLYGRFGTFLQWR